MVTKMTAMAMAKSSPTLSLYLKWQKTAPQKIDKCISMLAGSTLPSITFNPILRVPAIMTTSAILMEAYSLELNPSSILPTLEPVPFGYTVESKFKFTQTNPNECLHVADYSLTATDLQTLRPNQWLNDQVVDAFLKLSSRKSNDKKSLLYSSVLPSYLGMQWANGDYNTHLFLQVSLLKYHIILLPVCSHDHWFLLAAFPKEKKIYVLDSKENHERQMTLANHWRKFMHARQERQKLIPIQWTLGHLRTSQQEDGDSCGVFVLMNATALLKKRHPCIFRQCHVDGYRKFISHKLFSNSIQ